MNQRKTSLKERIFTILEPGDKGSHPFEVFITALIVLNVIAVILQTVEWIYAQFFAIFDAFEVISVAIFTAEYILRLWSCTVDPRFKDPLAGRIRFAFKPLTLIDLLAILPFYLPMILPEMRSIRAIRLFRLFRILKLARYSRSLNTFMDVLRLKKDELEVMLFALIVMLVVSASVVYQLEHDAQPEAFSSIPAAMWWGVVTLATVGYGDVYPVTPAGKLVGSIVVILGIGLFALPTGILASGFSEVLSSRKSKGERIVHCPHCGHYLGKAEECYEEPLEK